jgi:arylsulfatase A-like enzyme
VTTGGSHDVTATPRILGAAGDTRSHPDVSPSRSDKPLGFLLLSLWFALITGLTEVIVPVRRHTAGTKLRLDPQVVWMASVADFVLFGLLALMFALVARWAGRRRTFTVAFAAFLWMALTSFPVFLPKLHSAAVLLLMAGVAVHVTRFAMAHETALARLVRRTVAPLAATVIVLALGLNGWKWLQERRAIAALPDAKPGAKNVLLLILDTVRARDLSLYGFDRPTTPNLARFAQRGVRFDRAIAPASWTLASHASMFTGRAPHELSVDWLRPLDNKFPTLAEYLGSHGYATAGFVANMMYTSHETGLSRGFVHYEDYPISAGQVVVSSAIGRLLVKTFEERTGRVVFPERKRASRINRDFLSWLDRGHEQRPFFAFLNFYDAHDPYQPSPEYERRFAPHLPSFRRIPNDTISDQDAQRLRDLYDASIAELDADLGRLFAELESRKQLDSTIVIITSDHGEEFNEHGIWGHGSTLYRSSLRVPLVIAMPNDSRAGSVVGDPVTLRTLARTVVSILGLKEGSPFPGLSMLRTDADSGGPPRPVVVSEIRYAPRVPRSFPVARGDMRSIVEGPYHLIRDGRGAEELYDVSTDTLEQHDLASSPAAEPVIRRLRGRMAQALASDNRTVLGRELAADEPPLREPNRK